MYIKHTLSAVLVLACLLAACGSPAATPETQQNVITPIVTPEDQQNAVRGILGLPPNEPADVCQLEFPGELVSGYPGDPVECDSQGNIIGLYLVDFQQGSLP